MLRVQIYPHLVLNIEYICGSGHKIPICFNVHKLDVLYGRPGLSKLFADAEFLNQGSVTIWVTFLQCSAANDDGDQPFAVSPRRAAKSCLLACKCPLTL